MRRLSLIVALACAPTVAFAQAHPSLFLTARDAAAVREGAAKYPLLGRSLDGARQVVGEALSHPMDVPPPGDAAVSADERHKQNYHEMELAGELFQITGETKYAAFVRDMLEKYAVLYPTLDARPLSQDQAPGKLFDQSLDEASWLLATAIAYDCVYDWLKPAERARFETNVFRPMADWLSVKQAKEFDRIHTYGTWATAAVGMIGFVMRDTSYVNRALYGTKGDRSGGFLRQLDLLFSPDGYYMEGPYYIRYALLPFYQFAEAINRNSPDVHIYDYRGGILKKGLYAAIATTFPNGVFAPINDGSRTMDVTTPEIVVALDLAYGHYGPDTNLLAEAAIQREVVLTGAGLAVAKDLAERTTAPRATWPSAEFVDGPDGTQGGLGILRAGAGEDATMLLMKYGVHGQAHGHFDKLHFIFYDGGNEVVPDYGFARWINIEPKYGGRYLPENDTYAMQTIAHNTVVVDETTQTNGNYAADERKSAQRHYFDASSPWIQAMSARADGYYDGVGMQRTMFLVRDTRLPNPVVVDLYRLTSAVQHTYDYPLHFRGQLISTSVKYDAHSVDQRALGTKAGYQHIWNEASGTTDSVAQMTSLDGHRYYTVTTSAGKGAQAIFGRTGAGDPNFNLVVEPMMIIRQRAADEVFASVIEPHGFFSEVEERSASARSVVQNVRVIASTAEGTIVEVTGTGGLRWTIMTTNGRGSRTAHHVVSVGGQPYEWTGNFAITGQHTSH